MCEQNKDSEYFETEPVEDRFNSTEEENETESVEDRFNSTEEENETESVEDRFNSKRFAHLWQLCENCETVIYKKYLIEEKGVCEECGSTLQMSSAERIELLIDDGTWIPMDMNLSTIDVLAKEHTTFDLKTLRRISILLYKIIYHKYFYSEFFEGDIYILKTVVEYYINLVNTLKVVLYKKLMKYLDFDKKGTIKLLQDIIGTSLKTVRIILLEIRNRMQEEVLFKGTLGETLGDIYEDFISLYFEENLAARYEDGVEFVLETRACLEYHNDVFLRLLSKMDKRVIHLEEELLSQDTFLKVVAVNLVKIELYFPEEKRKTKKRKRRFPFYPGDYPETSYFLWHQNHIVVCLMERYLVLEKFKYWFKKRYRNFLKRVEFPRYLLNILAEYAKKEDRDKCYNIIDDLMHDDPLYSTNYEDLVREINDLHEKIKKDCDNNEKKDCDNNEKKDCDNNEKKDCDNNEKKDCDNNEKKDCDNNEKKDCDNNEKKDCEYCDNNEKKDCEYCDNNEKKELLSSNVIEIIKQFSTLALAKEQFSRKKRSSRSSRSSKEDIEDIEDTEDTEEYPFSYHSLTKEEKEYVDTNIELFKKKYNIGKKEFIETEEQSYEDYNTSYQKKSGLPDAIQTGIGQINNSLVALGVMDFKFMGGSMGSVVGEKITRLIQYATEHFLPVILVCASGGARMQEGSFSLMQMNKISAMLHTHQKEKHLLYMSVLTSPTTGGVTASFGMLGNVTIVEPNAYIAFAGKRVIEQTLNQIVDEEDQTSDSLFDFGMFDSMVPRALLKRVLSELIEMYMYGN
uniref:Acetyl-coenzyme A carboxylase carboxyl transferase subunit beta, chloroplastic n=2 Tax=Taiwania TaxID=25613 RepID=R4L0D0_9CONI|nr:acetyl-CoA carboxylase beta subunit [Taiwania flousiana]AGL11306.1 acetyl-CoA carboxylase beta subunit [Taiwania flousiana]AVR43468.1 acetyl-CoA carboxylase beta subunit [Taiwania cryptomerioides]